MALGRDEILSNKTLPTKELDVPEFSGSVFIKTMTGNDRDTLEDWVSNPNMKSRRANMMVMCVANEAGEPLFTKRDIPELGLLDGRAAERICQEIIAFNKMSEAAAEEVLGNSKTDSSGDSQ